ncbi:hypothetical protein ACOSQ3_001852 [Xanthoceras sorbifolium]
MYDDWMKYYSHVVHSLTQVFLLAHLTETSLNFNQQYVDALSNLRRYSSGFSAEINLIFFFFFFWGGAQMYARTVKISRSNEKQRTRQSIKEKVGTIFRLPFSLKFHQEG